LTPSVTRTVVLACSLLAAALAGAACTDDSGNGNGNPGSGGGAGTGGGQGGTGGTGGASAGGSGGSSPNFMAVAPCNAESDYMIGTTVAFPMTPTNFSYSPKCLKVPAGTTVAFDGDFATHPLAPSTHRGTLTGSPITATTSGTTKSVVFATPGYYAYFCTVHGPSDGGAGMVGVVWVE
jgi:plastocyanin